MRKTIALTTAAGLLVALAACSSSTPSGTCEPTKSAGDASEAVVATGAFGANPEATFPTPLISDGVQVSTLTTGEGRVIYPGQFALTAITLYDANEAGLGDGYYDEEKPLTLVAGKGTSKLGYAVECQTVGSRVAVTLKGEDLYGFQSINESNIEAEGSFVIIIDIRDAILGKAYGVDQVPAQGLPAVVTAPDGTPGITVPGDPAPAGVRVAVLKKADGAVVKEGDAVYLHFLRVDWNDPASFKSTWKEGGPQLIPMTAYDASTGTGFPAAIVDAIVGQTIGSQIIIVVPPAYGFAEGAMPEGVSAGQTLVYVIDILG